MQGLGGKIKGVKSLVHEKRGNFPESQKVKSNKAFKALRDIRSGKKPKLEDPSQRSPSPTKMSGLSPY
jgi:hypothetical protein